MVKKALVIGYARSGKSVAELLKQNNYQVAITDSNKIADKELLLEKGFLVYDEDHPDFLLEENWSLVVKNPGIPYHIPFVEKIGNNNQILNEIEVALMFSKNFEVAAITGTNGKTTTTTLLGEMLQASFKDAYVAGNIGLPLSEISIKAKDKPAAISKAILAGLSFGLPLSEISIKAKDKPAKIALEIAAFQLLAVPNFKPKIATILNLTPDHLDYFDSIDDYYNSKLNIFKNQSEDDYFLLNIDDDNLMKIDLKIKAKIITYSLKEKANVYLKENQVFYKDILLFDIKILKIVGKHNVLNAMVAATMAYLLNVSVENIQTVLKEFKGVVHRLEFVKEINKVSYYNDSKATNVESQAIALQAFEQPVILLAGGYDKKTGFDLLKKYQDKIKTLIAFGDTKYQFQELFPKTIITDNLQEAILLAFSLAKANDIVLFSPGCASFDQYNNFEERGDHFKEIVNSLEKD